MPIYEYKCRKCGDKFEKLVRSSASEQQIKCPNCDSDQVERQISVCGFLGGSGDFSSVSSSSSSCAPSGGG